MQSQLPAQSIPNRRKLFWPVGILSLAILPILLVGYVSSVPGIYRTSGIEINLPPSDLWGWVERERFDIDIPPDGKWQQFQFGASEIDNTPIVKHLQENIRKFMTSHDTIQGIHILLDRKTSYNIFIKVLDILQQEKVSRYSLVGAEIWIPRFPRRVYFPIPFTDRVYSGHALRPTLSDILPQVSRYWFEQVILLPPVLLLAWLVLFYVNIRRVLEFRAATRSLKQIRLRVRLQQ
jgi:biopolymer transport protein ExbD